MKINLANKIKVKQVYFRKIIKKMNVLKKMMNYK